MRTVKTFALSALSIAAGVAAAVLAAPLLHTHAEPAGRMQPMWANPYQSLEQMTVDADAVVLAEVTRIAPGRLFWTSGARNPLPFTLVDLDVTDLLRGEAPDGLTVEQTGGEYNGIDYYLAEEGGPYRLGEQVLLFLHEQADTGWYYVSHPKGRFHVEDGVLHAVLPEDPVAQALDGRRVEDAASIVASVR